MPTYFELISINGIGYLKVDLNEESPYKPDPEARELPQTL